MSARTRLVVFVAAFLLLYGALQIASGFQRWFINDLTVPMAAWVINISGVSPVAVHANGSRLVAPGGGLNVLQGCEGLDLLCLWIAAVIAGPFTWRARLLALTLGSALVVMLNQIRLVSLYQLFRLHRAWFDDAHGLWWPLALVALVWGLFALWQRASGAPMAAAVTQ